MKVSWGKQFSERTILHRSVFVDDMSSPLELERDPHSSLKWKLLWEGFLPVRLKNGLLECVCRQVVLPGDDDLRKMKQRVVLWVDKRTSARQPLYDETRPFHIYPQHNDTFMYGYFFENFFLDASGKILELKEETENEAI